MATTDFRLPPGTTLGQAKTKLLQIQAGTPKTSIQRMWVDGLLMWVAEAIKRKGSGYIPIP
jgi:hypothetical protein